jgi:hypothetical protein
MAPDQVVTENTQRTMWIAKEASAAAIRAREADEASRDYHYYDHSRDYGQDPGFGLGL